MFNPQAADSLLDIIQFYQSLWSCWNTSEIELASSMSSTGRYDRQEMILAFTAWQDKQQSKYASDLKKKMQKDVNDQRVCISSYTFVYELALDIHSEKQRKKNSLARYFV